MPAIKESPSYADKVAKFRKMSTRTITNLFPKPKSLSDLKNTPKKAPKIYDKMLRNYLMSKKNQKTPPKTTQATQHKTKLIKIRKRRERNGTPE